MGIITMDQTGYDRLSQEIELAKAELQRIQRTRTETMRSLHSSDAIMDVCDFVTAERQATKKLNDLLAKQRNAKIVDSAHTAGTIGFGSIVKVLFLEDSSDSTMELKVVSVAPREGEASIQSPIGAALYGHRVGDVVGYSVGSSFFQAKVISID